MVALRGLGAAVITVVVLALAVLASSSHAAARGVDPLLAYQWHLRTIQAPSAWAASRGAGVIVAVLDTGVAYEDRGPYRRAPDLQGTHIVAGRDFVAGDTHPDDVAPAGGHRSHGTQMATIIAATADDGIGGAGVAPRATIMPIRVLAPDLAGSARAIAHGLRFAADHGADVANLSIAGPADSRVLRDAIDYAYAKGVTIVAAAGNDGRAAVGWPAANPKVIAVGAVARDLTRATYSNYGRQLDVVAPGGAGDLVDTGYGPPDGVLSQTLKGGPGRFCFCFSASTSAAAAEVSGVAALLLGSGRVSTPAAVRTALESGALDLGAPGRDPEYGAGLVQARAALASARSPTAMARRDGRASTRSSTTIAIALGLVGGALVCVTAIGVRRRRRRMATS